MCNNFPCGVAFARPQHRTISALLKAESELVKACNRSTPVRLLLDSFCSVALDIFDSTHFETDLCRLTF